MHKGFDELRLELAKAAEVIEEGAVYAHYKDPGSRYIVKEFDINESSDEVVVIHFPDEAPDIRFVRPVWNFLERIDNVQRFTKII